MARPRRESLWEEAEIEGLDMTERTPRWDAAKEACAGQNRTFCTSFRRNSAMSLLHQLLGQDGAADDGAAPRDRDEGHVSPRETTDPNAVSVGIGGDAVGFGAGGGAGAEMTLRSPKNQRLAHGACPLLPPPSGPRK